MDLNPFSSILERGAAVVTTSQVTSNYKDDLEVDRVQVDQKASQGDAVN